jgi:hypothetical protein
LNHGSKNVKKINKCKLKINILQQMSIAGPPHPGHPHPHNNGTNGTVVGRQRYDSFTGPPIPTTTLGGGSFGPMPSPVGVQPLFYMMTPPNGWSFVTKKFLGLWITVQWFILEHRTL